EQAGKSIPFALQQIPPALEAIDQREGVRYLQPLQLGPLDRLQGGRAGGDHVLENGHRPTRLEQRSPFDPLAGAVPLRLFANEERRKWMPAQVACQTHRRGERIGAQRQAANGADLWALRANLSEQQPADQKMTFGGQSGPLAVDVKVRLLAGGERDLASFEGELGQQLQQPSAVPLQRIHYPPSRYVTRSAE